MIYWRNWNSWGDDYIFHINTLVPPAEYRVDFQHKTMMMKLGNLGVAFGRLVALRNWSLMIFARGNWLISVKTNNYLFLVQCRWGNLFVGKVSYNKRPNSATNLSKLLYLQGYLRRVISKVIYMAMVDSQEMKHRHWVGQFLPSQQQSVMVCERPIRGGLREVCQYVHLNHRLSYVSRIT